MAAKRARRVLHVTSFRKSVSALATGQEHAGLVTLGEGLAKLLDDGGASEWVWREYRQVLKLLLEEAGGAGGDEFERLIGEVGRRAAEVRNDSD